MKPSEFIKLMAPMCERNSCILVSVTLAQAIEESGWGTSSLYNIANASFGVKATSQWEGKVYSTKTKQVYASYSEAKAVGGTLYRAYNSIEESVKDHDSFLLAKRYTPVRNTDSYKEACTQLQLCGYCPDDGYADRLIKIIELYSLMDYDNITFPFKVRVCYKGEDGVNVRKKPVLDDSVIDTVNGPIHYGDICTVVARIDGFYKTKSGLYITSNSKYIERV